jgi:hypothetical protein
MNWKRLASLTEDGMKYTQYIANMDGKEIWMANKKFTRESNNKTQLEKFKIVSARKGFNDNRLT